MIFRLIPARRILIQYAFESKKADLNIDIFVLFMFCNCQLIKIIIMI